jgi:hypothetical protein
MVAVCSTLLSEEARPVLKQQPPAENWDRLHPQMAGGVSQTEEFSLGTFDGRLAVKRQDGFRLASLPQAVEPHQAARRGAPLQNLRIPEFERAPREYHAGCCFQ